MVDDGHAPTIPETEAPTHPTSRASAPVTPDTRYEMRTILGRGGMGEIWLAYDVRVDREVAIKVMRGAGAPDSESVARFLREARVQGRLEHPAIVPVHDLGIGDAPFFVMKRLSGTTLADVLAAKGRGEQDAIDRWPIRTLLARLVDVCLAIELAHRRGVIHRDLKPANLMLGDFGEAYVLDWGLARIREMPDGAGAIRASDLPSDSGGAHTVAGAMLGTPGYMAPEQVRGEDIDHRTDIYALGCILFEILAGQPAVPRDSAIEATLAADGLRPSRLGDVPPELDDTCARATAAAAAERQPSARALADEIQRFLDGDRDLARRRELAAEHVAAAQRALARGDAGRAEAMREAGRAIAIDPTTEEAKQLLARLLLEPPAELPSEARHAIESDRRTAARGLLRRGAINYAVNFLVLVGAKLAGVPGTWPFIVLGAALAIMLAGTLYGARRAELLSPWQVAAFVVLHGAMIATASVILGTLLFAPVLAFGSLPLMLLYPGARRPVLVTVVHLLALAVPVALELFHVVPSTFVVTGDGVLLRAWAVTVSPSALVAVLVLMSLMLMLINAGTIVRQRDAQEGAEERVHLTAWHLRQLVR